MPEPVVDVCALWLDRDSWRALIQRLAGFGPRYLTRFAPLMTRWAQADPALVIKLLDAGDLDRVVDVLVADLPVDLDPAQRAEQNQQEGITAEVLHGMAEVLPDGSTVNHRLLEASREVPGAQVWAGISLTADQPSTMLRLVEEGARGFTVSPFDEAISPCASACEWFFRTASEIGVPVWLHSGAHLRSDVAMDICSWQEFDRLAERWPDLTLVAGHGCWPWLREMVAVMQRHPQVYLEISTHRPARMPRPGSGFAPLIEFGGSTVAGQVLFGSGGPWVHRKPRHHVAAEVHELGLDPQVARAWLHDNATRLLQEGAA